jgi:hypothetical protein
MDPPPAMINVTIKKAISTICTEQSPTRENDGLSDDQEIPCLS